MSKEFKDLLKLKEICHVMTVRTKRRSIKDELNSLRQDGRCCLMQETEQAVLG